MALQTKLAQRGASGSSAFRSDGSHDGQAGGWTAKRLLNCVLLSNPLVTISKANPTLLVNRSRE
jgi:hypothetical protein